MWTPSLSAYLKANIPTFVYPIRLMSNVRSVNILSIPSTIQEGEPFGYNQTQIQVLNNDGKPAIGKLVMCLIESLNGQKFNYRYSSSKKGYLIKDITKPFPGKYDSESLNPLSDKDIFFPIVTNNQGIAQFNESSFSIYGIIGNLFKINKLNLKK